MIGVIQKKRRLVIDAPPSCSTRARLAPDQEDLKPLFRRKLAEMSANMALADKLLEGLRDTFTFNQLADNVEQVRSSEPVSAELSNTIYTMLWLARANCQLLLPASAGVSDIVIMETDDFRRISVCPLMYSDMPHFRENATFLAEPRFPWELLPIGNCGSPIETEGGWLLIAHGVGPMRRYGIGAVLLDLDDPTRIIGRLRRSLLSPGPTEREG